MYQNSEIGLNFLPSGHRRSRTFGRPGRYQIWRPSVFILQTLR